MAERSPNEKPVWFITGCSTGFGRELAKILSRAATASWRPRAIRIKSPTWSRAMAEMRWRSALDVEKQPEIEAAVEAAKRIFGRIDVLVNNAGYGYLAAIEEGDDTDIRSVFETNVFGLAALIRAVLPIMRPQKSGAIVNISSMGGFIGFPGSGYYAATKFAVEGLSEVALQGGRAVRHQGPHRRARSIPHRLGGTVAQDPEASGRRLCGDGDRPPQSGSGLSAALSPAIRCARPRRSSRLSSSRTRRLRLPLGNFAYDAMGAELEAVRKEYAAVEAVARGADYPKGA